MECWMETNYWSQIRMTMQEVHAQNTARKYQFVWLHIYNDAVLNHRRRRGGM